MCECRIRSSQLAMAMAAACRKGEPPSPSIPNGNWQRQWLRRAGVASEPPSPIIPTGKGSGGGVPEGRAANSTVIPAGFGIGCVVPWGCADSRKSTWVSQRSDADKKKTRWVSQRRGAESQQPTWVEQRSDADKKKATWVYISVMMLLVEYRCSGVRRRHAPAAFACFCHHERRQQRERPNFAPAQDSSSQ